MNMEFMTDVISIHTTRKVVTCFIFVCWLVWNISIHTTRKVVTVIRSNNFKLSFISIHTTRKVVTVAHTDSKSHGTNFNPHHPQGGDSNFAQKPLLIPIHLHQQSAPNSLYILHSSTSKSNPKKYLIKIPVRIPRGFHVRFRFALKDQRLFHINPLIHSNMFNPCLILIPQIIKSEAIHIFINQFR